MIRLKFPKWICTLPVKLREHSCKIRDLEYQTPGSSHIALHGLNGELTGLEEDVGVIGAELHDQRPVRTTRL